MRIIDLSMNLNNNIEPYPNDPKISIINTLDRDGYNLTLMTSTMHNGTHVEVKKHMGEGKNICHYSLDHFILKGLFSRDFEKFADAVVHPMKRNITMEEAKKIVENKVKMLIIDKSSPDEEPYEVHKYLLENDIIIVENAVNIETLEGIDFYIVALPLKIEAEASLTRLIAIV